MNTQRRQWLRWGSGFFAAGLAGQGALAAATDLQLVWRTCVDRFRHHFVVAGGTHQR